MFRRCVVFLSVYTVCWSMASCRQRPKAEFVLSTSSHLASSDTTSSDTAVALTISAAASLQEALEEIKVLYEQSFPKTTITYNFGASGALAQQITQGAPVDVFLSASPSWMDVLAQQEQIVNASRLDWLKNTLVLVVPQQQVEIDSANTDTFRIDNFVDLTHARVNRIAMGVPESVPAGQYAKELLVTLNLFDSVQEKLVLAKSVRQVLSYVETENVDAGLIYATDAQKSDRVSVVAYGLPDMHSDIRYSAAALQPSIKQNKSQDEVQVAAAVDFVEFLSTDGAIAIFREYGFSQ